VFFRGAWGSQDTNCDAVNGGQPVFPGLPCVVNTQRSPQNLVFNYRWSPKPNVTNEAVFGQSRFTFNFALPSNDLTKIGFNSAPVNTTAIFDFGNLRTLKTYQVVDNLTWIRGAHTLKFGTNLRFQKHFDVRGSIAGQDATTDIDFSRDINTVDPATFHLPTNLNVAFDQPAFQDNINFLLGRVGSITRGFASQGDQFVPGLFKFESDFPELDFYAQDTWKVTPRLSIDAGLRWEIKLTASNPDNLLTHPNQDITAGAPPTNTLKWVNGSFYNSDFHAFGPSIGVAWDPTGEGKTSVRANYRLAYDRIQTFTLSSTVIANLPGLTQGLVSQDYGQAGGRLSNLQPLPPPTVKPSDLRQPPPFSSNGITVVDPSFKTPTTHEFGLSLQHQIARNTIVEADYIGRRAYHLFGAYNANQDQIFGNGFVDAFNTVKAGGDSPLIDKLVAADNRLQAGETGSQLVRRLFASTLSLNSVAALANTLATRIQGGQSVTALSGAGAFPLIPFPQFGGFLNVIDSNDFSTYHALQVQLQRRYSNGFTGQVSYSFSKSLDTRSFDPTFSQVSTGNLQSAANTPVDIHNRRLNYAPSDFDRTHVIQGYWVYELPFGPGKHFGAHTNSILGKVIGGWEAAGVLTLESGRPFTVYAGSNTVTNVRQTPANCDHCPRDLGGVFIDPVSTSKFYFTADQRAKFSTPAPGDFSNTGRNYFRGPGYFDVDATFSKNIQITERFRIQLRTDATNLANHPSADIPTATITSSVFGRIRGSTQSASRKFQLGAKFYF